MKLTTLEIKGFKSFADKTVLHFNESITGVVGPNGCGKSNVVDAIRWVLGEQKPTVLRTERMENLIFNGTKARKSSGMAEVSLTFDNTRNLLASEFSSVTVSRHYFKTGESEYRINGVPCRLKDIHNLFLDTGISTDSYSIIELGMLDDILHDKDNSRRRLFEQAAGISKYKIRKKETINKLSATQQDLDRVEDLLFEIENNLKELERQAKRAQKYQRLKADYKTTSIDLAVLTLQSHKDIFKQLSNQQTYESDERLKIETEINSLEAGISGKKTGLLEAEQHIAQLQKELNALTDEIRNKENDANLGRERIKFLEEKKVTLGNSISGAEAFISDTASDIERLERSAGEEEKKLAEIRASLQEYLDALETVKQEHDNARGILETAQQDFKLAERAVYDLDKRMAVNKVRLENYHRELGNIEIDSGTHSESLQPLRDQMQKLEEEKATAEKRLHALLEEEERLKQSVSRQQDLIEIIRKELNDVRRNLDAVKNEFKLTRNLYESLDGFPESIRFLKKEVAGMQDAPLLSDIISCDEKYTKAVESYLDPWLNYYVVDTMQQAVEGIQALAGKDKGRANFFLLDAFREEEKEHASVPGFTAASTVIQADERFMGLIHFLLDNVYIQEEGHTLDEAQADWALANGNLRLVESSGRMIRGARTLSGGSSGVITGKRIGREKAIQKLEQAIRGFEKKESQILEKLGMEETTLEDAKKALDALEIRQARESLNTVMQQLAGSITRIETLEQQLVQMQAKKEAFIRQIEQTDEESISLHTQHDTQSETRDAKQKELLDREIEYREISERLNLHSNRYNQENIRYHQQLNKFNSVDQDRKYKVARVAEARELAEANKKQLAEVAEEILDMQKNVDHISETLLQMYDGKVVQEQLLSTAEEKYYASRGEVGETEDKIRALQKKKENTDQVLGSIKDKLNELKVQLAATRERLMVEFQVELESILDNEVPQNITLEELQEKADHSRKRLENYGEVNPMAIQAFEEMKTRYDFIKTQREDLINAKESLLTTIQEIDATARKKFDEAFLQIRDNFKNVFRSLFNEEDDCDLILKDDYDPLEAQIDVIAKPKGKKPQVIDQLSGGEKTLTGMSLLFALYLLKPAPFCILDEVDAPLDDTNITKFNNTIRKFAGNSQFIIVTHNKRTMAEVDIIYGVTMPEQGISRVVPVDFRSLN